MDDSRKLGMQYTIFTPLEDDTEGIKQWNLEQERQKRASHWMIFLYQEGVPVQMIKPWFPTMKLWFVAD